MHIVDASVALKWVLPEDGADDAIALIGEGPLAAPDLLTIECANVLWVKARRKQISNAEAQAALAAILSVPLLLVSAGPLAAEAQTMALALRQTAYDCLYLAVAMSENAVLVTADEAFFNAVLAHGTYRDFVRKL
jgi:predicted nucleic acid-binding protein